MGYGGELYCLSSLSQVVESGVVVNYIAYHHYHRWWEWGVVVNYIVCHHYHRWWEWGMVVNYIVIIIIISNGNGVYW